MSRPIAGTIVGAAVLPGILALVAGVSKTCGARFACSQFVRAMVPVATTILKIQGGGEDSK